MFGQEELLGESPTNPQSSEAENLCTISLNALDGSVAPWVLQLHGFLKSCEVSLLVDSDSWTSFVDSKLVTKLQGLQPLPNPCKVKVANGIMLHYTQFIPNCQWTTQGYEFTTNFKALPMGAYDAILGMDWLKQHSPMNIDWIEQVLAINSSNGPIVSQATTSAEPQCSLISAHELLNECKQESVAI